MTVSSTATHQPAERGHTHEYRDLPEHVPEEGSAKAVKARGLGSGNTRGKAVKARG